MSKPIGMYGETPRIKVGKFTVCMQDEDSVWIEVDEGPDEGEGMQAPLDLFTAEVGSLESLKSHVIDNPAGAEWLVNEFYVKHF